MNYWLLIISNSLKRDGLLEIQQLEKNLGISNILDLMNSDLDFNTVLHILSGDNYFEQNKKDVVKLEKEAKKKVTELWDTDPIFAKYPALKTLARNREFEIMWAKMKAKQIT